MVKIQNPYEIPNEQWEKHQHFFQPLLDENYQKVGDPFRLLEFEYYLKKGEIVFYPSSGSDINDVIILNSNLINKISSDINSRVYFHCDYLNTDIKMIEISLSLKSFKIKAKFLYKNEDTFRFIQIYKLKHEQSKKLIWFVYFSGYYNEEIIDFCIDSKLKTKVVYSYCDGITSDRMNCNPYPIPTIFFPFMVEELGIESIITEQDAKYITEVISKGNSRDIQNWLHKVNAVVTNGLTAALLEIKDTTELRNKIIEALTRFEEHPIDEIEHPKLVIKKIS
jgi:hypothetical protein